MPSNPRFTLTSRRRFIAACSALGVASSIFPKALWSLAQKESQVTKEMIAQAATVAGIDIPEPYREMMLEDLNDSLKAYEEIHKLRLPNSVVPALHFNPVLPGMEFDLEKRPMRMSPAKKILVSPGKSNLENLAFAGVRDLGEFIRRKKVSSSTLTEMYLERLKRYDPLLKFVITLTEDRARAQAREADADLARGKYRGPLHGLPWGAKDLLAVKGYVTTWGAGGFESQNFAEDATVVKRLDRAGAVLVAKLTLGALAQGDVWYGGMTRNPWKPEQGSSGSSAGPASATAAGCVAFAIGSETLGSISSPSTRCGTTGLRPTFGRIPRTGAMALSWSMDKLGPICRQAEDCALVLNAIYGPDGIDPTVHAIPFNWDADLSPRKLRVGFVKADFEKMPKPDDKPEDKKRRLTNKKFDDDALQVLKHLGVNLIEIKLPEFPFPAMHSILIAEAGAAFDDLTRSGRDKLLTAQGSDDWPNTFRAAHFIPAIEYINANRARTVGMQQMAEVFKKVDVIVAPTYSPQLLITNLTGHPAVILPNGFREDGTPVSLTFLGNLFGEASLVATARAYQEATEWHRRRPQLDRPNPSKAPEI